MEIELESKHDEELLITAGADLQIATLAIMAEMYRKIIEKRDVDDKEEREKYNAKKKDGVSMIQSKQELHNYLVQDSLASKRKEIKPRIIGDYVWKFQYYLRHREYEENCFSGVKKIILFPIILFHKYRYNRLGLLCSFSIPLNTCGPGLSIAHPGTIIINSHSRIGKNCRMQTGVTLGSTNGTNESPVLGDNVFLGEGAKIIGKVYIANNVAIGANAVVVHDILEENTTWGGVPAKKISNNGSANYMSYMLKDNGYI